MNFDEHSKDKGGDTIKSLFNNGCLLNDDIIKKLDNQNLSELRELKEAFRIMNEQIEMYIKWKRT